MRKNGFYSPLQAFDWLRLFETLPLLRKVRLRQYNTTLKLKPHIRATPQAGGLGWDKPHGSLPSQPRRKVKMVKSYIERRGRDFALI